MIRIDTTKIPDWEIILKNHKLFFEKYVDKKINEKIEESEYCEATNNFLKNLDFNDLAVGRIKELTGIAKQYDDFIGGLCDSSTKPRDEIEKSVKKLLKEIFNYSGFRDNKNCITDNNISWNRHTVITLMKMRTCPYCNRQYITTFEEDDAEKTTADLDHFYPQTNYPILALSLYNFVPSCQICNSRFKGDVFDAENHIYPYEEEFGSDCKFTIKSETLDYIWDENFDFNLGLHVKECQNKMKIENSIKTFKLDKVYNIHKDYVYDLIKKATIYNDETIKEIFLQYPGMFKSEDEVWQCVMGNYLNSENLGKRPLSKLTQDICETYGITNFDKK